MKTLYIFLFTLTIFSLLFNSCEKDKNTYPADKEESSDTNNIISYENIVKSAFTEKQVIDSANTFYLKIFNKISVNTNENVFISPLSIGMALAMTSNGADGITKYEMEKVLGFENATSNSINIAYKSIYDKLMSNSDDIELSIANSIWYRYVENEYLIVDSTFKYIMEQYYYSNIYPMDSYDPSTKDTINAWVEEKTNNRIKNIVNRVIPDDVMFLVNAIYFNATWKYKFDKNLTFDSKFYKEDGSEINCKMMKRDEIDLKFYSNSALKLVELPYNNENYTMVIILPVNNNTTYDIITKINTQLLTTYIDSATIQSTDISIPKFKVLCDYNLKEILISLGINKAFSELAEFPFLFSNNKNDILINKVLHKAFIDVNEEGTEAAAATVVEMVDLAAMTNIIILNRPFLYFIREKSTGIILFAGKLMEPVISEQ